MVTRAPQHDGNGPAALLRELRKRAGYNQAEFARALDYKTTSGYQRYEDPHEFGEKYLPIAKVLEFSPHLLGKGQPPIQQNEILQLLAPEQRNIDLALNRKKGQDEPKAGERPTQQLPQSPRQFTTKDFIPKQIGAFPDHVVPIMGTAQCGDPGRFTLNTGDIVGFVDRPPQLNGIRDAYCLYAVEDSMEPRYHHGELVYINPVKPPTQGCYVVVQLMPAMEGDAPPAMLKQYIRRDDTRVLLHQYNPDDDIRIEMRNIVSIHRVVLSGEA